MPRDFSRHSAPRILFQVQTESRETPLIDSESVGKSANNEASYKTPGFSRDRSFFLRVLTFDIKCEVCVVCDCGLIFGRYKRTDSQVSYVNRLAWSKHTVDIVIVVWSIETGP